MGNSALNSVRDGWFNTVLDVAAALVGHDNGELDQNPKEGKVSVNNVAVLDQGAAVGLTAPGSRLASVVAVQLLESPTGEAKVQGLDSKDLYLQDVRLSFADGGLLVYNWNINKLSITEESPAGLITQMDIHPNGDAQWRVYDSSGKASPGWT